MRFPSVQELMKIFLPRHCTARLAALLFLVLLGVVSGPAPSCATAPAQEVAGLEDPGRLWLDAEAAAQAGELARASGLYLRYYEKFRQNEKAEEALWQAARLAKKEAEEAASPDWEGVRNLFRSFTTDFAESRRAPEAYFEVGYAHYRMRFFREALIYFKLFGERYPNSPLLPLVRFWHANTFFAVDRLAEAAALYNEVAAGAEEDDLRIKARMGLGDTLAARKDHAGALAAFSSLVKQYPDYILRDPELLSKLGVAHLRLGNESEGRKQLYHYYNLSEDARARNAALFEVAESSLREGEAETALKLFELVIERGGPGERVVVLAQFRVAEYFDDQGRALPKWQKRNELTDPEGDKPFLAVLDSYHAEPIAQDARRGLFIRYRARKQFEDALVVGKSYLRNDEPGLLPGEKEDFANTILLYLGEELFARQQYENLYQLYAAEHRHVNTLNDGRFLFLVGRALEALSLYEQAAVVYYRGLALPLSPEDKRDLYFRRAEVYLLQKNHVAADRLLTYLRDIYKDGKELGEVAFLSGRLSEALGRKAEALDYYARAASILTFPERKGVYAEARLRLLFSIGSYPEVSSSLEEYRRQEWLAPEALQGWYRRLGDALAKAKKSREARDAYLAGVGEKMPQEGRVAQELHLLLGELFLQGKEVEQSREHLEKAQAGPDKLLEKKARERLNQIEINQVRKRLSGPKG